MNRDSAQNPTRAAIEDLAIPGSLFCKPTGHREVHFQRPQDHVLTHRITHFQSPRHFTVRDFHLAPPLATPKMSGPGNPTNNPGRPRMGLNNYALRPRAFTT